MHLRYSVGVIITTLSLSIITAIILSRIGICRKEASSLIAIEIKSPKG